VIQQRDSQQLAGVPQLLGDGDIFAAWFRIASRVVVRHDDGRGHELDSRGKGLARVHQVGVERAPADFTPAQKAIPGIEEQGHKVLLRACANALLEEGNRILGAGDFSAVFGPAFFDEFDVIEFVCFLGHRGDNEMMR